jgi:ribosome-associated toxin RatA of RatAB toxin-antitoxin module
MYSLFKLFSTNITFNMINRHRIQLKIKLKLVYEPNDKIVSFLITSIVVNFRRNSIIIK